MGASQTECASPSTPPIISANAPFVAFSQAVKDGSFLVVTLLSIPSSATHGPNMDFSSDEGSEEVIEDFEDKPILKKRVSDSNEDDGSDHEAE